MNSNPIVSVIIPFLNPGPWLSEAIESVLNQTYANWELILIDDGSVEADSLNALDYARRFPEAIFYLMHDGHINKGLTASRNLGVQQARGEFVAFLDADDCWLPVKLERQLNLFDQNPVVQMICEPSIFWYSWEDAAKENQLQLIGASTGIYSPPQLVSILYPFGEGQPPCPSGIMIRSEALKRNGGFEESFSGVFQLYEDQAFLFKIYCNEVVYIAADANNFYRKRKNSMSSAADDKELYNMVRRFFVEWAHSYLSGRPTQDPIVYELVQDFKNRLA